MASHFVSNQTWCSDGDKFKPLTSREMILVDLTYPMEAPSRCLEAGFFRRSYERKSLGCHCVFVVRTVVREEVIGTWMDAWHMERTFASRFRARSACSSVASFYFMLARSAKSLHLIFLGFQQARALRIALVSKFSAGANGRNDIVSHCPYLFYG